MALPIYPQAVDYDKEFFSMHNPIVRKSLTDIRQLNSVIVPFERQISYFGYKLISSKIHFKNPHTKMFKRFLISDNRIGDNYSVASIDLYNNIGSFTINYPVSDKLETALNKLQQNLRKAVKHIVHKTQIS